MTFNWKKTLIALIDIVIAGYLVLAVSAFNTPAEKATVCSEVKIDINNESVGGFVTPSEIKNILEKNLDMAGDQEPVSQMPQNDYVRGAEAFNI